MILKGKQGDELEAVKRQCRDYWDESNTAIKERKEKWKNLYSYWVNTKLSQKRPKYKSTTRINYCWIITQVKVPIIMASNPTVNYISYEKDENAEDRARKFSKTVGKYLYNKLEIRDKLINAILDSQIYDAGFLKVGFDPKSNEIFVVPVDLFKLFPDPLSSSFKNARFVCHAEVYPLEILKKRYEKFADSIKEDLGISEIVYEKRKWEDRKPSAFVLGPDTQIKAKRAFVKEYWLSPEVCDQNAKDEDGNQLYKNGRVVTIVNDKVVVDTRPYPYQHGLPPYVRFISNKVPNDFWGYGDIEQIAPLNDTLNHRLQQLEDIANMCANLGWTIHPQAGKKAIQQLMKKGLKPGLLKICPPDLIERDQPPNIPQWLFNEIQQLMIMIERVSGVSDIMQGRGDVRQRTARGIERLFEAGSSRISTSVKLFEDSFKELAYQMGELVQQYYGMQNAQPRQIVIPGGGRAIDNFEIGPEDLRDKFEISIDSAAALPQDKQSKAELAFTLLKNHIFELAMSDDPKMKMIAKTMLDVVEFPNREALLNFGAQPPEGGFAKMPQFAGWPVMTPQAQEMATAAGMTPEELIEMVRKGMTEGPLAS